MGGRSIWFLGRKESRATVSACLTDSFHTPRPHNLAPPMTRHQQSHRRQRQLHQHYLHQHQHHQHQLQRQPGSSAGLRGNLSLDGPSVAFQQGEAPLPHAQGRRRNSGRATHRARLLGRHGFVPPAYAGTVCEMGGGQALGV